MMTERKNKITKYVLVGGVILNLGMTFNLYHQVISLQYQVTQLENDSMSAIQALSRYVWEIKNHEQNGNSYSGGNFE